MKVAYIKWVDARGVGGNRPLSVLMKMPALVMETAGLLVSEDKEVLRIVQDIYSFTDTDGELIITGRDAEIIPKKYIISSRIIDIGIDKVQKDA